MTAVLCTSAGSTGIWWYARTKSILEKMVDPRNEAEKSWMCGMGYLSGCYSMLDSHHVVSNHRVFSLEPCAVGTTNCWLTGG